MWHKLCRTFHPWCPCTKTRCLLRTVSRGLGLGLGLGLGRVRQGAKMLITPVACGCLIKQRCQPILAGNCRIGLRHWGGETIPLWNCAVDERVFEIVSSGWKFPHLVLVLGSGARVTLLHPKVFRVHSYVLVDDLVHVGQLDVLPPFLLIGRCWWVLWDQYQMGTVRYSEWSLVRMFSGPKIVHRSEWSIVRQVGSAKGHWSENRSIGPNGQ